MSITVREVTEKKDLNRFIKFAWKIYQGNPNWVPPLIIDMQTRLNPKKNPYYEHSEAKIFIAERDGEIVGRIGATVNNNYNRFHEENIGFFGFFECIDDQSTANALFDKAAEYLRGKKVDLIRGPMNWNTNDDIGWLVDAFDQPPLIMMTYNPPYYNRLAENYGFKKTMDVYAYWEDTKDFSEKVMRIAEKIKKRDRVSVRKIDMKKFWDEVKIVKDVYNSAWSKNWGFVPMTEHEFTHLAKDLKMAIDPDFVYIAEVDGKAVGFCLTLPDINEIIIKLNGRLFPFGIIKLLTGMKKIKKVRVITMGVIPEYLKRGIDSLFYLESFVNARDKGKIGGEFSWILENNDMMNRAAVNMGGKVYKTYRIYDYAL